MSFRINLTLDEQERRILDLLVKKYGGTAPQILRESLKIRFDKAFPPHTLKEEMKPLVDLVKPIEMTSPQICEYLGGVVVKDALGDRKCSFKHGTLRKMVPLYLMGQKGQVGDYRVDTDELPKKKNK